METRIEFQRSAILIERIFILASEVENASKVCSNDR